MKGVLCLGVFLSVLSVPIFGKEIVLTFDDFPMASSSLFEKTERAEIYASKLAKLNVQAVFYCIGEQIDTPEGRQCVESLQGKHLFANHSYHHPHASELSLADFKEEVRKTERLFDQIPQFRKWFRFPYLDLGNRKERGGSLAKAAAFFHYLEKKGYRRGYTTINTLDWYLNGKILKKEGEIDWEALKQTYLLLLEEWIEEHVALWPSRTCHVLLLHQNDLNALYLEEIVALLREGGWEIVSPEKALHTPLARFFPARRRPNKTPPSLAPSYVDQLSASSFGISS